MNAPYVGPQLPHRNTIEEAAAVLKVSIPTLYRRVAQGLLKTTKDGGRTFISGAELVRYMAACDVSSQPEPAARSTT